MVLVDANKDGKADIKLAGSSIVYNADGTLTYTPAGNSSLTSDEFQYQAVDKYGAKSGVATVKVTIRN